MPAFLVNPKYQVIALAGIMLSGKFMPPTRVAIRTFPHSKLHLPELVILVPIYYGLVWLTEAERRGTASEVRRRTPAGADSRAAREKRLKKKERYRYRVEMRMRQMVEKK